MKRVRYPMPADVERTLRARKLTPAYRERPAYQQNDYVGWITGAKQPTTRQKRIDQMVTELANGGVYMNMAHKASAKPARRRKA